MRKIIFVILIFSIKLSFAADNYTRQSIIDQLDHFEKQIEKEKILTQNNIDDLLVVADDKEELSANNPQYNSLSKFWYFSGGGDIYYLHYREINDEDSTLDKETGWNLGWYIQAGYQSNWEPAKFWGKFFWELYYMATDGELRYDGSSSAGQALSFDTNYEVSRYGLKVGGKKKVNANTTYYGYLDFGKRIWKRGENGIVSGVLTYKEIYKWYYIGFGAGTEWVLSNKLTMGFEGEIMVALAYHRQMYAHLYDGGKFNLGSVWGSELKLPVHYKLKNNWSLDLIPYFTFWRINQSNTVLITSGGVPVGNFIEPESNTYTFGLRFGVTYYWF